MATFYNQATLTHNGIVTNSNITEGEILEAISMTKTPVNDEYWLNSENTYVVSIINSGETACNNITIIDDLGQYEFGTGTRVPLNYVEDSVLYYVNGVLQTSPAVTAGPPLSVSGISVPAGGNAMIIYSVRANQYAPLGENAEITNTVTATSCCNTTTAEATVTARNSADLTITKSLSPTVVVENGRLTYTIVIRNYGNTPAVATDDTVITDVFDPALSNLEVTFNGVDWAAGTNYTYNSMTGMFSTNPSQVTVPAASYTQNPSGEWVIQPGVSTLTVSGNITG